MCLSFVDEMAWKCLLMIYSLFYLNEVSDARFIIRSPLFSSFPGSQNGMVKYFKPPSSSKFRISAPKNQVQMAKFNQVVKKKSNENDSISSFLLEKVKSVAPATRLHLLLSLFCTFVQLLGFPAAQLFSLEPSRPFELWRILTSMTYFGPPSLYMANSLWFMIRYGQSLETEVGSAHHLWFLILQTLSLSVFGLIMGYKYQARSLLAAVVYASSQLRPTEKIRAQFGLTISSWQLPFLLMALDCISTKSILSAWPHVMGMFSSFLYNFIKSRKPTYLTPPMWISNFYQSKRKISTPTSPLLDLITSGAIIPPPPPIQDFRKIKLLNELVEQKQKRKYQKKVQKGNGIRIGSKIEEKQAG